MTDAELPAPPADPPGEPSPGPDTPPSRAGNRRLLVGLAVGAVALAVAVIVLSGGGDDDGDADTSALPSAPTLPEPVTGELSEVGQELVDLLSLGEQGRYHAVYVVEGDPAVTGGEVTFEVWRDGDRARADTLTVTDDATAETVSIVDGDEGVSCTRVDDAEFTCEAVDPSVGVAADVVGSIRDQLVGAEVTEHAEEVDGRQARCFSFATPDGPGDLCASPQGVVLRLGVGDTVLRLTDLDDDIPVDAFAPPAEVGAPSE